MKKFLKKNWFKLSLLIIILASTSFFAYWTQIKPANARQSCTETVKDYFSEAEQSESEFDYESYNFFFDHCLNEHGVKP